MTESRHLYIFFWRPDTFAKMSVPVMALCRKVLPSKEQLTCTMSECTCEGCRETFIEGLPTGSGKVTTWEQAVADQAERKRRADEANAALKAQRDAAWTTGEPTPVKVQSDTGWTHESVYRVATGNEPPSSNDGWTTKKDDGWKTK